jgi:hypothetical protein
VVELPHRASLSLVPLAEEISRRFFDEFPDERDRYGDAGRDWCVHDNQWLLAWAAEDLAVGGSHFANNVRWLAGILRARDYPAARLGRDLEIAADVVSAHDERLTELAAKLRSGAKLLRR